MRCPSLPWEGPSDHPGFYVEDRMSVATLKLAACMPQTTRPEKTGGLDASAMMRSKAGWGCCGASPPSGLAGY